MSKKKKTLERVRNTNKQSVKQEVKVVINHPVDTKQKRRKKRKTNTKKKKAKEVLKQAFEAFNDEKERLQKKGIKIPQELANLKIPTGEDVKTTEQITNLARTLINRTQQLQALETKAPAGSSFRANFVTGSFPIIGQPQQAPAQQTTAQTTPAGAQTNGQQQFNNPIFSDTQVEQDLDFFEGMNSPEINPILSTVQASKNDPERLKVLIQDIVAKLSSSQTPQQDITSLNQAYTLAKQYLDALDQGGPLPDDYQSNLATLQGLQDGAPIQNQEPDPVVEEFIEHFINAFTSENPEMINGSLAAGQQILDENDGDFIDEVKSTLDKRYTHIQLDSLNRIQKISPWKNGAGNTGWRKSRKINELLQFFQKGQFANNSAEVLE